MKPLPQFCSRDVRRWQEQGYALDAAIRMAAQEAAKNGGKSPSLEQTIGKTLGLKSGEEVVLEPVTPRARSRDLEHVEQRELFKRIREHEGEIPILRFVHAVPNGGARSKATAGKLWAEGVRPGPPDIYLDTARRGFHGFRGEQKAPGCEARTSEEQREWHAHLRREGYYVTVQDTWHGMWNELMWYLELETLRIDSGSAL